MLEVVGLIVAIVGAATARGIFGWKRFNKDEEHRLKFRKAMDDPELAESYLRRVARWIQRAEIGPGVVQTLQDIPRWRQGVDRYIRARALLKFDESRSEFVLARWKLAFFPAMLLLLLIPSVRLPGSLTTDLLRFGVSAPVAETWGAVMWLPAVLVPVLLVCWVLTLLADALWLVDETRQQTDRRRSELLVE